MREHRLQRNLKILVGGLGFLILAGLLAIAARVLTLASGTPDRSPTATAKGASSGDVALALPRGAKIVSVSVSGNRLAVHHDGPAGAGIAVVDLDSGRQILNVKPIEAPPRD